MDNPSEVAEQIKVLLSGLARRADGAGLEDLARRLEEVAREAGEQTRKPKSRARN